MPVSRSFSRGFRTARIACLAVAIFNQLSSISAGHAQHAGSAGPGPPPRSALVVAIFRSLCLIELGTKGSFDVAAYKTGFAPIAEAKAPAELKTLMAAARARDAAHPAAAPKYRTFMLGLPGRPLYGVQTEAGAGAARTVGCFVYDIGAGEPLDAGAVKALLPGEPAQMEREPGRIELQEWREPGLPAGYFSVRVLYLPAESPLVAEAGFTGSMISAVARAK